MNPVHLVRATDPLSSVMAAERAVKFASGQYAQIRSALLAVHRRRPELGVTSAEMAALSDLSVEQVCRRLPELRKAGFVKVMQRDDGADKMRDGFRCWTLP